MAQALPADADHRQQRLALLEQAVQRGDAEGAWFLAEMLDAESDAKRIDALRRLAADGNMTPALLAAAEQARTRGAYSEAERLWRRADARGSGYAAKWLAWLESERGEFDLAELACRRAVDRGRREALVDLAGVISDRGRRTEAMTVLHDGLEQLSAASTTRGANILARWYLEDDDPDAALGCLERVGTPDAPTLELRAAAALSVRGGMGARAILDQLDTQISESFGLTLIRAAIAFPVDGQQTALEMIAELREESLPPHLRSLIRPLALAARRRSRGAAWLWAEIVRHESGNPSPGTPKAIEVQMAYRRAGELGAIAGVMWDGYYETDEQRSVQKYEEAAAGGQSWASERLGWHWTRRRDKTRAWPYLTASGSGQSHCSMGWWLEEEGDADAAMDHYRKGSDTNALAACRYAMRLRKKLGARDPDVEAAYSRADLRRSLDSSVFIGNAAKTLRGDEYEALGHQQRADRRGSAAGAFNVGVALQGLDERGAEAAYRRCIERGDVGGHVGLARLLRRQEHLTDGLTEARAGSDDPLGWELAGEILEAQGDRPAALVEFIAAGKLGSANAAYNAARLSEAVEAQRHLDRAQQLLDDDRHGRWLTIRDRDGLRRQIERHRRELPKVGGPTAPPSVNR
ncbi:MAG: hypothetical protein MSC31_15065 [Solirubrobacteraceae bacterium MAG38_C4-C5]|nr:hypothetical protein [Candidatus Siliceabacter maunaloa]